MWATTYKLTNVTSVSAGNKYVFVRNSRALSNTASSGKLQTTGSYSTTGLSGSEAYVWTLETATDGFYLKNASLNSDQYLNNASSTNMSFGNKSSIWSIAFTDGVALISNNSNSNRFIGETSSGSNEYKAYAASNLSSYGHDFSVYVLEEEAATVAAPSFSPTAGTYTSAQSVTLACATDGASIYYTSDGTTPTSASTKYTKAIDVYKTMTIKAIAIKGSDASTVVSATYTIVSFEHAGTEADPYSVADARTAIDNNIGITGVYATGIVSEIVTAYNSTYENISFNISKDGKTTSDQLQAYRCVGATGIDVSEVQVGDEVVISGNLKKHNDTYEFDQNCELVSLAHSSEPIIAATPTSLTGFTYGLGNGPSAAQNFSVSGSNLTEDITLTPTTNYEISLAEASGYASSLTIAPTAGTVDATTVYVRLKAGLAKGAQEGTISLESTGATKVKLSLSGSVTTPVYTWDLSKATYDEITDEDVVTWSSSYVTMTNSSKSGGTKASNYLGGDANNRTSSRFYAGNTLTITPASGYIITSIEFTATSDSYASALQSSTWTNATAVASDKTVTVTPINGLSAISATIGGTCGFTEVKVYYEPYTTVSVTIGADEWATYVTPCALDFTGLTAYVVSAINANSVTLTEVTSAPAGTGVILNAAKGTYKLDITDSPAAVGTNELMTSRGANVAGEASGYDYYVLANKSAGVGFYKLQNGVTIPAGKCFLAVANTSAPEFLGFGGDDATGINAVNGEGFTVNGEFYNLNGQRVAQPKKGLYIVNGKKVVIK